jgi:hypothetical protein
MSSATKRDLLGRTIVGVDFGRFHDSAHGWRTDPVLILDNGRRIYCVVQETNGCGYGVALCITDKMKKTEVIEVREKRNDS